MNGFKEFVSQYRGAIIGIIISILILITRLHDLILAIVVVVLGAFIGNYVQQNKDDVKQKIFFEGQIWDSYSLIIDFIKKANNKIVIIDNYIDDSILKMLAKKKNNVESVIITSEKSNISKLDIQKFNKEYPILKVAKTNKFHDRFIVIDNKELYHCGASIKDLGKKCFAITKIEEERIVNQIMNI